MSMRNQAEIFSFITLFYVSCESLSPLLNL